MIFLKKQSLLPLYCILLAACCTLLSSCDATRHLPKDKYLLRSNTLKLQSDRTITRRGELKDGLAALVIQKPNTYALFGLFPYKVWLYNMRYRHYAKDSSDVAFQQKSKVVEKPVIYDSVFRERSEINLKGFLFQQGYFYAKVKDTTTFKKRRAYVKYEIETGLRYLINNTVLDIDDSTIRSIVVAGMGQTALAKGEAFAYTLTETERSRIANQLRNAGYYKFTQENISFVLDTVNKAFLRDAENPFESAINFIALQRQQKKPTLDVHIIIRKTDEPNAYRRYKIGRVQVYPDFKDRSDVRDSTMIQHMVDGVTFRYHKYYVHEGALLRQNFLQPGDYYMQDNYDRTITKLNELGLFQYVRLLIVEDSTLPKDQNLRAIILLNPVKKYDFSTNYEVSNGSTYSLGNDITFSYRNRNLLKGANQLTLSLSGGIEAGYDTIGKNVFDRLYLLSRNAGITSSIVFPKFISPIDVSGVKSLYQPRTILSLGYSLLDRVDYFTLSNTAASFAYNWRRSQSVTYDLTPAFINILRLPRIADSFQHRLDNNEFLRNAYHENFIEGESFSYTFSDQDAPHARRQYSYLKLSAEEGGALLSLINGTGNEVLTKNNLSFSQYLKFDADARHYFRRPHATLALRFLAGVGLPYDKSTTVPYVKQYFSGGAYSIRGWRVRQLGPGSYYAGDSASNNFIDRTGDIKLEVNAEYRFDIVQLFSGALHLAGAIFTDAGNIWLAHPTPQYPGGEFALNKLGQDIAASSGAGARIDIGGLFTIRLDAAFPIKKPYVLVDNGWVLKDVNPLNKSWRSQNLVLQIAIGYPF